jgi:hypothetical protein
MIISFGLTVNELLSGTKTVTRRFWSQRQIDTILRLYGRGRREHQAWDKNPRLCDDCIREGGEDPKQYRLREKRKRARHRRAERKRKGGE